MDLIDKCLSLYCPFLYMDTYRQMFVCSLYVLVHVPIQINAYLLSVLIYRSPRTHIYLLPVVIHEPAETNVCLLHVIHVIHEPVLNNVLVCC